VQSGAALTLSAGAISLQAANDTDAAVAGSAGYGNASSALEARSGTSAGISRGPADAGVGNQTSLQTETDIAIPRLPGVAFDANAAASGAISPLPTLP
jgi:hypothetical protein